MVSWKYEEPYSVYNLPEWDKCVELGLAITDQEQYGEAFYSVKKKGVFLGYYHIENNGEYMELTPVYNFINDRLADESAVSKPLS